MPNFAYNRRAELAYARDILGVVRRFFAETYEATYARLLSVPEWLEAFAHQAAERMVTHSYVENARSWRAAASQAGHGAEIYAALQRELRPDTRVGRRYKELIDRNAQLIKSLPREVAELSARHLAAAARAGERATASEAALLGHVARSRARLIARTETAKANAALTQSRAEGLGLDWYVWRTSGDSRVRFSHRKMGGVLVRFAEPPSPEALAGEMKPPAPYNAGEIYNCRCYAEPLLKFSQVNWPHRAYVGGRVRHVNLYEFRELNRAEEAA